MWVSAFQLSFQQFGVLFLQLPLFELRSEGYINYTTMKGGCFLTDGRHVACGSENLQVRHRGRLPGTVELLAF